MIEFFRFFRLGIVNLMGITFPGFLILGFIFVGIIPVITLFVHFLYWNISGIPANTIENLSILIASNKTSFIFLIIIFSYILGSIVRLSTPDDLDKISAKKVLSKMAEEKMAEKEKAEEEKLKPKEAAAKDHWPTHGEEGDKFPYFYFKKYLESRNLGRLAKYVDWQKPDDKEGTRTKTLVNIMKLEIGFNYPELAAIIDSNEAHVRLSFGIWLAIKTCLLVVFLGFIASLGGVYLNSVIQKEALKNTILIYILSLFVSPLLLIGMLWAKKRIENLFHYQRVRELTHIVGCKYFMMTGKVAKETDSSNKMSKSSKETKKVS